MTRRSILSYIPTLAAMAFFALFIALGRWQLSQAEKKAALFAQYDRGAESQVEHGPVEDSDAKSMQFMRIGIFGSYLGSRQFLLDNSVSEGRVGYEVVTPVAIPGQQRLLLVDRGWVPLVGNRGTLPDIDVDDSARNITGRIGRLPVAGLRAGPGVDPHEMSWPKRVQFPTTAELEQALGAPLFGYLLLLDGDQPDGYVRMWRPRVFGPERHYAYALQWFALAAAVLIVFVALKRRKSSRESVAHE